MSGFENPFTPEQVHGWERMRDKLIKESNSLSQKIDALNRALGAAQAFSGMESSEQATPEMPAKAEEEKGQATLVDAISAVLMAATKPLSHKEIRKQVPSHGFSAERLLKSPNYYYTAINRLMDREEYPVQKTSDKKFWIEKSETADGILPGMAPSTASNNTGLPGR